VIYAAFAVSLVALGVSVYAVVKGEIRARRSHEQRVAIGPAADDARAAIERARKAFDEIVARGGLDRGYFWESKTGIFIGLDTQFSLDDKTAFHGIEVVLRDNAGRLGDSELRASIERIAGFWDKAFLLAPFVYNDEDRCTPTARRQLADQVEVAHEAQDECAAALRRLNELEAGT
jgi:hypothetical protein